MLSRVLQSVLTALILAALTWLAAKATDGWLIRSLGGVATADLAATNAELQQLKGKTTAITYTPKAIGGTTTIQAGPNRLDIQSDGNVVVYDNANRPVWNSQTPVAR